MIIQNEYCDGGFYSHVQNNNELKLEQAAGVMQSFVFLISGGSLSDAIVKKEAQGELFTEAELKDLLLQVAMGLKYIHSSGLVHLDVKPSTCLRPLLTVTMVSLFDLHAGWF